MCFGGYDTPPSSYKLKIWEQLGITSCQMKTQTPPLPGSLFACAMAKENFLPFSMVFYQVLSGCGVGDHWAGKLFSWNSTDAPVCAPERWT